MGLGNRQSFFSCHDFLLTGWRGGLERAWSHLGQRVVPTKPSGPLANQHDLLCFDNIRILPEMEGDEQ
jgi:hypothetical protein